jgi:hypothetical protein
MNERKSHRRFYSLCVELPEELPERLSRDPIITLRSDCSEGKRLVQANARRQMLLSTHAVTPSTCLSDEGGAALGTREHAPRVRLT